MGFTDILFAIFFLGLGVVLLVAGIHGDISVASTIDALRNFNF